MTSFFPFAGWIRRYNTRWLVGDLVAGITLGLVVVPQALSYALLANLSPEYGLYTSFTGAMLYWLFGTSKDIAIGATAVVSLLVGKTGDKVIAEHGNEFSREQIAKTQAFLAGCVLLLFGLFRLDWIIEFIPHVAISAFVTGAAITITLSQAPTLLGITGINSKGPAYEVFINVCKGLPRVQLDAAIGVSALVLLGLIKWACEHMAKRQPYRARLWNMLCSLRLTFTILLYTLISFLVHIGLTAQTSRFRILGQLPVGFTRAGPPSFDPKLIASIAPDLPATIIVLIIEHIAIGKSFARLNGYTVIPSQELVSIAFTNLTGPFVGAYASTGSFGGSAILSKAGVRTPLAGIFNGCILVLALYALTSVLYYIPLASLSALIIHAVVNLITSPDHVYHSWLMSPFDVLIYFCGVFVSIFTSLEDGIYTTVALSIVVMLVRVARTQARFMGQIEIHRHLPSQRKQVRAVATCPAPQTTPPSPPQPSSSSRAAFLPLDRHDGSNSAVKVEAPTPGVFIYRFSEGFNYINQAAHMDHLISTITAETQRTCPPTYAHPGDRPWNEPVPVQTSKLFADDGPDPATAHKPTLKAVVFDFSAVNNLDTGAAEGLAIARDQLNKWASPDPVQYHFAGVSNRWARRALAVAGFGYPSKSELNLEGGKQWDPMYSVAEKGGLHWPVTLSSSSPGRTPDHDEVNMPPAAANAAMHKKHGSEQTLVVLAAAGTSRMAAVYGVNRPNFHVDLTAAVEACMHNLEKAGSLGHSGCGQGVLSRPTRDIEGEETA
ncbi:sulfate transporter family-domain-containing protein [Microdochium bolleyi]|uniref:Sulfate transporter family-domain-containing protein n=1 Tax=Microdochium bolleyi TaxID=196109 RepID=A0A136ILT9_9PEZI|nr:sulfate transporter family-domain-containing protein [Microdochium bolleyi]